MLEVLVALAGPFPVIQPTDVVTVETRPAEFYRHGFAFEGQTDPASQYPPSQNREYIVNR